VVAGRRRGRPRKEFALIQGKEPLLARSLLAGADGIVVSLVHLDPKLFAALYRAAIARDRRTSERCQHAIQKFYDDLQTGLKRAPIFSTLLRMLERGIISHGVPVRLLENRNGSGSAVACISKIQLVSG
jgi:dihydrodipicolinate synthase/N-acetylneuraminate lyase